MRSSGLSSIRFSQFRAAFKECGWKRTAAFGWKEWCINRRHLRLKNEAFRGRPSINVHGKRNTMYYLKAVSMSVRIYKNEGVSPYFIKPKLKSNPMSSLIIGMRALYRNSGTTFDNIHSVEWTDLDEYTEDRFSIKSETASAESKTMISCPTMFKYKISVSDNDRK